MPVLNKSVPFLCWIQIFTSGVFCYNVDTKFPIVYKKGPVDNYFGFSVGLLQNTHGYWALITAPRANSTSRSNLPNLHQTGVLFSCSISTSGDPCEEVVVDKTGNVPYSNTHRSLNYINKLDDMWLGVSLDIQLQSADRNVVVCGHLWKNDIPKSPYVVNGACYVLDSDLDPNKVNKIVPFVDTTANIRNRRFYVESAQAGASAAFSEDGRYLLLGSPGFENWSGTFVSYLLDQRMGLKGPIISETDFELPHAAYLGYSITSGQFFGDGIVYRATGAPRDNDYNGRVYIFPQQQKLFPVLTLEGKQTGEYFGASVSAIDLTGDGVTDLLVGAPFYSENSGGDEGKVYFYKGTKQKDLLPTSYSLNGENKPNARFGTCIGNVGDLNQDGFNDVVIGAPYEDEKGAVYIYHGRMNGIHRQYTQRIGAEEIHPLLSGFGISISRGLDIDGNSYPDILIGSYASSNAVLLRTYTAIKLRSTLSVNTQKINMNITCDVGGLHGKFPCVIVKYCVQYSGKQVASSLGFQTKLRIDTARRNSYAPIRGFFLSDGQTQPETSISRKIQVRAEPDRSCFQETAYIHVLTTGPVKLCPISSHFLVGRLGRKKVFPHFHPTSSKGIFTVSFNGLFYLEDVYEDMRLIHKAEDVYEDMRLIHKVIREKNISDEITAVEFLLSYDLDRNAVDACQSANFSKDCPVIDPKSPTNNTKSIRFQIDCENKCQADLSVDAYIAGNPWKRTLIVGQNNTLTLDVTLRNSGEPAYITELFITLPPETPPVKYEGCERVRNQEEYANTSLRCSFRNPLKDGEEVYIQVVMDLNNIPADTSSLTMYFRATTESDDTDKSNNDALLPLYFETAADFNITGNPENPRIPQTEESGTVLITHNYYVKYYGPSPVDKIDIYLHVPTSVKGETASVTFLTINTFMPDRGEISKECNFSTAHVGFKNHSVVSPEENPYGENETIDVHHSNNSHHIVKRDVEESTTVSTPELEKDYTLDCESSKCEVIHCSAGPFLRGQKSMKFTFTVQVDLDLLSSVMKWNSIKFVTKGEISVDGVKPLSDIYRNETTVETAIVPLRPPGTQEVQKWIIFVSIGVGLLLLLIILMVLIKIGFFKRKQRDRMRSMKCQPRLKEMQDMSSLDVKETADDKGLCSAPEN